MEAPDRPLPGALQSTTYTLTTGHGNREIDIASPGIEYNPPFTAGTDLPAPEPLEGMKTGQRLEPPAAPLGSAGPVLFMATPRRP